jgi:hypothetical protein
MPLIVKTVGCTTDCIAHSLKDRNEKTDGEAFPLERKGAVAL